MLFLPVQDTIVTVVSIHYRSENKNSSSNFKPEAACARQQPIVPELCVSAKIELVHNLKCELVKQTQDFPWWISLRTAIKDSTYPMCWNFRFILLQIHLGLYYYQKFLQLLKSPIRLGMEYRHQNDVWFHHLSPQSTSNTSSLGSLVRLTMSGLAYLAAAGGNLGSDPIRDARIAWPPALPGNCLVHIKAVLEKSSTGASSVTSTNAIATSEPRPFPVSKTFLLKRLAK